MGGPEIGAVHKSQKVGGPRPARPNRLRRQCLPFWEGGKVGPTSKGDGREGERREGTESEGKAIPQSQGE